MTMKIIKWAALALFCFTLAACAALTPEQVTRAHEALDLMLDAGTITMAQYDALVEALNAAASPNWWQDGLYVVGSAVAAYFGIQLAPARLATRVATVAVAKMAAQKPEAPATA